MTNPNFTKGIGRIAVDLYDFHSHINGTGFRQDATTIDVSNPSAVFGNPATVEAALEDLNSFIVAQINAGQGFAVVGDGYNTWHNANGTINYDPTVPSLDTILNPIFTAIVNGTPLPAAFQRVKYGGIILIKAGTYIVKQTINVPPSITLLGEGYGTKIVNATSMDFSGSPPPVPLKSSPTPASIFAILADGYRSTYNGFTGAADSAVDPNLFIFSRETRIFNMVIADNFVEPTILGDNLYKLPQNVTSATALNPPPLIAQQVGSSLSMNGVMGMGRVNFSSGKTVNRLTGIFLGLDALDGYTSPTETFCKVDNCFIDGFAIPIDFSSTFTNDGYGQNFLEIKNCKMRSYGYLNGDSSDGYANATIKSNVQNISISGSLFYGNATNVSSLLFLTAPPSSTPALQDRSKIVVVGNQVIIDKGSSDNSTNSTWLPLYFSAAIPTPATVMTSLVYGNDFQDTFDIYVDDGYQYTAPGLGAPQLSINKSTRTTTLRNDTIALDGYNINLVGNSSINNIIGATSVLGSSTIEFKTGSILQVDSSAQFEPGSTLHLLGTPFNTTLALMDGYSRLQINGGRLELVPTIVTMTPYTMDNNPGSYDLILLVPITISGPVTIILPPASLGRWVVIKDTGSAGSHNITILPQGITTIDAGGSYLINTNFGSVTLLSDGVKWWSIAVAP